MLVTLITDFGGGSSYVAAMKGALLAVNPAARLLDLTHDLPPQNLIATAYFLADALPWFPDKTIHVVVVDPGVGTERSLLCVEWRGQHVLVPDNGCWTSLLADGQQPVVHRLAERRFWRRDVSATFHGRDILAPVAGHLSLGVAPAELGPVVTSWQRLDLPRPATMPDGVRGEVVIVDRFGNLISNVPGRSHFAGATVRLADGRAVKLVRTYGDAEPGTLVALIGSSGRLEVAVVNGSAAARLGLGTGTPVEVTPNG
ncbi:MAG TPA: SAM-dependent chlorinase/fluorinase [Gemmataceae bacterium]|nr:SAM-dependent chlorinase/fluorinase [Gemmataceae bacterium]